MHPVKARAALPRLQSGCSMPRPKVHPDARQRVIRACSQCQTSKRKCNASRPCNHCTKRGMGDVCDAEKEAYDQVRHRPVSTRVMKPQKTAHLATRHSSDSLATSRRASERIARNEANEHTASISTVNKDAPFPVLSPDTTRARMFSNNRGEYVFVGKSASLSFMQLVGEAVAQSIGPCDFSDYAGRDRMLEIDIDLTAGLNEELELTDLDRQFCLEHFLLATTGLIDLLTPKEITELLASEPSQNSYLSVVRLLIIAIAKQTGPLSIADAGKLERGAFAQARLIIFTRMLEDPSLNMIRAFLLLSFYMLGACRRNAAFLYLGVAARAAHTLGLHIIESYSTPDEQRYQSQIKCWKSLVTLDLIVSSILGRTTAVLANRNSTHNIVNTTSAIDNHPSVELEAVYRLALLVDTISSRFNGSDTITAETARWHLQSLSRWSDLLPARLKPDISSRDVLSRTRQSLLGCMHISCFYYFAVMLVTRPFLIINVTQRLSQGSGQTTHLSEDDHVITQELASACLQAATFMAQTCSDLLEFDVLEENMCILKAWVFAAGLVLGFEAFASCGPVSDIERAFDSCRRVLQNLSQRSAQASQYHDIMILFAAAIEQRRNMQRVPKPAHAIPLVIKIMDLSSHHSSHALIGQETQETSRNPSSTSHDQSESDSGIRNVSTAFANRSDGAVGGFEHFSIQSPGSFQFDLQTIGMMPWTLS